MCPGIVEERGTVTAIRLSGNSGQIDIRAAKVLEGTKIGDSIAVNGICLTVVDLRPDGFTADIMAETVRRSSIGACRSGDEVNLERAMAADGRFGGHMVAGHIDGTGTITSIEREENAVWFTIAAEPGILKYVVAKGSIAIDGISLTVAYVDDAVFKVSVIPHTAEKTTLLQRKERDRVNLETDMVGKYIEKLVGFLGQEGSGETGQTGGGSRITLEFLQENGF